MKLEEKFEGEFCARRTIGLPGQDFTLLRCRKGDSSSKTATSQTNQQTAVSGSGTAIGATTVTASGKGSQIASSGGAAITTGSKSNVTVNQNLDAGVATEAIEQNSAVSTGAVNALASVFSNTIAQLTAPVMQTQAAAPAGTSGTAIASSAPATPDVSGIASSGNVATGLSTTTWVIIGVIAVGAIIWIAKK